MSVQNMENPWETVKSPEKECKDEGYVWFRDERQQVGGSGV